VRERVALLLLLLSGSAFAEVPRGTYTLDKPGRDGRRVYVVTLPACDRDTLERVGPISALTISFPAQVQTNGLIDINGDRWIFDGEDHQMARAHQVNAPLGTQIVAWWWSAKGRRANGVLFVYGLDARGRLRCGSASQFHGTFTPP